MTYIIVYRMLETNAFLKFVTQNSLLLEQPLAYMALVGECLMLFCIPGCFSAYNTESWPGDKAIVHVGVWWP